MKRRRSSMRVTARVMPPRARDLLSAFAWSDDAARLWSTMTLAERRRVLSAARAEEEANRRYLVGERAVNRALVRNRRLA